MDILSVGGSITTLLDVGFGCFKQSNVYDKLKMKEYVNYLDNEFQKLSDEIKNDYEVERIYAVIKGILNSELEKFKELNKFIEEYSLKKNEEDIKIYNELKRFERIANDVIINKLTYNDYLEAKIIMEIYNYSSKIIDIDDKLKEIIKQIEKMSTDKKISIYDVSNEYIKKCVNNYRKDLFYEKDLVERFKDKNHKAVTKNDVYINQKCILYDYDGWKYSDKVALFKEYNKQSDDNDREAEYKENYKQYSEMDIIERINDFINYRTFSFVDGHNQSDEINKMFIYGEAGIGKTTLTEFLVNNDEFRKNNTAFVPIRLRDIIIENGSDKISYNVDGENKEISFKGLNGNTIFLFDGFDENPEALNKFISKINQISGCENIKYIITSRVDHRLQNVGSPKEIVYFKITYFNQEQVNEFLGKYLEKAYAKGNEVLEKFIELADVKENNMLTIPLLLYMNLYHVLTTYEDAEELTSLGTGSFEMYKNILGKDSVIFKKSKDNYDKVTNRNLQISDEEIKTIRDGIKKVSLDMFKQNELSVLIKDNNDETEKKKKLNNKIFEMYISSAKDRTTTGQTVEFIHKSFYDYFLAEKILEEVIEIAKLVADDNKYDDFTRKMNEVLGMNYISEYTLNFIDKFIEDGLFKSEFSQVDSNHQKIVDAFTEFINNSLIDRDFIIEEKISDVFDIPVNTLINFISVMLKIINRNQKEDYIKLFNLQKLNKKTLRKIFLLNVRSKIIYWENLDLSEIDLRNVTFESAVFKNVNFENANLNDVKFQICILENIKFKNTRLFNVFLDYTKMNSVDFCEAFMAYAILRGADLSGADLSGADLEFANLSGNDLSDANLRRANLADVKIDKNTKFVNVDENKDLFKGAIIVRGSEIYNYFVENCENVEEIFEVR